MKAFIKVLRMVTKYGGFTMDVIADVIKNYEKHFGNVSE